MQIPNAITSSLPAPLPPSQTGQTGQPGLSHRALLIRRSAARIPVTAEDLPVGFYRADLLPFQPNHAGFGNEQELSKGTIQLKEQEDLQAAYCELDYSQGYPTLPSGEPFWHKLDYEPGLAYSAFQIFLDASVEDARELTALADNSEFKRVLETQLQHPPSQKECLEVLQEYYILYYWKVRARAHDLFKEAAYRHKRIQRAMSAEDYHYNLAESLLKKVEAYLGTDDFVKNLTPKTALDALTKLVAIQRVSAGLPAMGPLQAKDAPQAMDFEMILRTIGAQQANANPNGAYGGSGGGGRQKNPVLDSILSDPTTAKSMQELVIRITTANFAPNELAANPHNDNPGGRKNKYTPSEQEIADAELAEDINFHK